MARVVRISATTIAGYLDGDDLGEDLNEVFQNVIEDMKGSPGGDSEQINLLIANDLEPEEDEDESTEESEDETEKKE